MSFAPVMQNHSLERTGYAARFGRKVEGYRCDENIEVGHTPAAPHKPHSASLRGRRAERGTSQLKTVMPP